LGERFTENEILSAIQEWIVVFATALSCLVDWVSEGLYATSELLDEL
jgi:hypothetical protein